MAPNCSIASPLSQKQKTIWSLKSKGFSVSEIAKTLKTTRQYVNQTRLTAEAKLSSSLLEVAQLNDLQVIKLYPQQALLLCHHPVLNRKAIVTYTSSYGLKVWYWYDKPEGINDQSFLKQTKMYLLELAKERGIEITDTENMHPAKLADIIFSKIIPELKT